MIEIFTLGTGSMFPTKERSHPCIFGRCHGINFLIDCGESAQRQMRIAGLSPMSVDYIFISHWHGDHSLGLPGLIQSMAANKRKKALYVFGPKGSKYHVNHILESFDFYKEFDIKVKDIPGGKDSKVIFKSDWFHIDAFGLKHSVPCIGFNVVEYGRRKLNIDYLKKETGLTQDVKFGMLQKGKDATINGKKILASKAAYSTPDLKFTYISDTKMFPGLVGFAKGANLLVSESTFCGDKEVNAEDYLHMTAREAGEVAKKAGVQKLVLTHFSQRYTDMKGFLDEALKEFHVVHIAKDFDKFEIK